MNFDSLIPGNVASESQIIIMAALSVAASVIAVWRTLLERDPSARRAKLIAEERGRMRARLLQAKRRREEKASLNLMRKVVGRFKLEKGKQADKISNRLLQAGWRTRDAMVRYFFFKLALPFTTGGLALLYLYGLELIDTEEWIKMAGCLAAVVVGFYMPDLLVMNAAQKRQKEIRKSLPDALDLMVICAEAGLSLDATLMRVSQEMHESAPEIADELQLTGLELGFLPSRRTALKNLAKRTDLQGVRGMVNTLLQAEKYGTPLAHSLRILSHESREERRLRAEEKAARLPALLTVPMIVFILPPLAVVLVGSAVLSTIDALSNM